jgi:hypothetical protein
MKSDFWSALTVIWKQAFGSWPLAFSKTTLIFGTQESDSRLAIGVV